MEWFVEPGIPVLRGVSSLRVRDTIEQKEKSDWIVQRTITIRKDKMQFSQRGYN